MNSHDELTLIWREQQAWHYRDGMVAKGYRRGLRFRAAELHAQIAADSERARRRGWMDMPPAVLPARPERRELPPEPTASSLPVGGLRHKVNYYRGPLPWESPPGPPAGAPPLPPPYDPPTYDLPRPGQPQVVFEAPPEPPRAPRRTFGRGGAIRAIVALLAMTAGTGAELPFPFGPESPEGDDEKE